MLKTTTNNRGRNVQWIASVLALVASSTLLPSALASGFLKIDDIDGESTVVGYDGWIDLDSFSAGIGLAAASSGTTRTRSAAVPESLQVEKVLDSASPYLFLASAQQRILSSVVLESSIPSSKGGSTLIRHEFSNTRIVNFEQSSESTQNSEEGTIHESVAFDFEEWATHYMRPNSSQVSATWNFTTSTGGLSGGDAPDRPQIEPLETLIAVPGADYTVNLNLSDADTPLEKVSVRAESLDPEKVTVLAIEGTGDERSLKIAVSEFFSGSASIQVWVSDDFQSASRTLMLTIEGGETPYETFLMAAFGEELIENKALSLPIGDPDNDGLRTIAEFYLGTDPNIFTPSDEAIEVHQTVLAEDLAIELLFFRRTDTHGLTGRFFLSTDLVNWTPLDSQSTPPYVDSVEPSLGPYEQVTANIDLAGKNWDNVFLRLQVDGVF